jgi:DNA-directed RNA polymerase specialized sigma24 family protein
MEAIVRNLPTRQREIIVATYFRRWTTREAAEWLGITPAEAKARLYQAVCELADVTDSRPTAKLGSEAWNSAGR